MAVRTTKRPKCSSKQGKATQFVKSLLRKLLLRPATWRWLIVNLPEAADRLHHMWGDVVSFFRDLM